MSRTHRDTKIKGHSLGMGGVDRKPKQFAKGREDTLAARGSNKRHVDKVLKDAKEHCDEASCTNRCNLEVLLKQPNE